MVIPVVAAIKSKIMQEDTKREDEEEEKNCKMIKNKENDM